MGNFQDMLNADAAIFLNTDEFAVTILYKPQGQDQKSIAAQVMGSPPYKTGATPRGMAQSITVLVSRADVPFPVKGGDFLALPGQVFALGLIPANGAGAYKVQKILNENDPLDPLWQLEATL